MDDPEVAAFARRWHVPLADAQRFAAAVAARCGQLASTMEYEGLTDTETLALAEFVGEQIRDAIAREFPEPGAGEPPRDRSGNWLGIGGPSKP